MWCTCPEGRLGAVSLALLLASPAAAAEPGAGGEAEGEVAADVAPGEGGAAGGFDPNAGWRPFALATTYGTYDAISERNLVQSEDGTRLSEVTETTAAGAGLAGQAGVVWQGERTDARLALLVLVNLREDEEPGAQSITQGAQAGFNARLTERLGLDLSDTVLWGVRDSERDLGALGAQGPTAVPVDVEAGQRVITRVPYVQNDTAAGLTWQQTNTVRHRLGAGLGVTLFPDEAFLRRVGERRFEVWSAGPDYGLVWTPTELDTWGLEARTRTTWFVPVGTTADLEDEGDQTEPIQTVEGRATYARALTPRWTGDAGLGIGYAVPLDEGGAAGTFVGGLGATWAAPQADLRFVIERTLTQSDVGAVFAATVVRATAGRPLGPRMAVAATLSGMRYDVLTQIFASEDDLYAFAAPAEGESLTRAEAEERARRAQAGYGLDATATFLWGAFRHGVVTVAYTHEQRRSDDRNRGDRQVHRGMLGLTVTSDVVDMVQAARD